MAAFWYRTFVHLTVSESVRRDGGRGSGREMTFEKPLKRL